MKNPSSEGFFCLTLQQGCEMRKARIYLATPWLLPHNNSKKK